MQVHTLRFRDSAELSRSFHHVTQSGAVEDCLVEPAELQLRFLAPAESARRVIERIYLDGGLTWCSRHELRKD